MLNYLGLPVAGVDARRRDRSHDRARALADAGAVRRLGRVLPLRAVPLPQGRESRRPSYAGAKGKLVEGHSRSPSSSSRSCCSSFYAIPAWADARRRSSRPRARRSSSASSASSSRGTSTIPGRTASSAAPTSSWCRADNPLGLDRTRSGRQGRHHDDQPAEPAGRPAGARAPVEQGRHPQLRPLRDAREAGRDSGPGHSGLVHPDRDDRRDAAS